MTAKKRMKMHFNRNEVIRATEEYLIQEWHDGRLEQPTSPVNITGALAIHALEFLNYTQGRSSPSEKEFQEMLFYLRDSYHLSPEFPCSNQELKDDRAAKIQAIQEQIKQVRDDTSPGITDSTSLTKQKRHAP